MPKVEEFTKDVTQDLKAALPDELKRHGLSYFYGQKGVKKEGIKIPPVNDATEAEFWETALLRVGTGFYVERERYPAIAQEV